MTGQRTRKRPAGGPAESNPALEPEPEIREPRTYEICGPRRVLGHEPGTTFTALIPPEQEVALIEGGHITPVDKES